MESRKRSPALLPLLIATSSNMFYSELDISPCCCCSYYIPQNTFGIRYLTKSKELFNLNFYKYNCASILLNNILLLFEEKFCRCLLSLKESKRARRKAARKYYSSSISIWLFTICCHRQNRFELGKINAIH